MLHDDYDCVCIASITLLLLLKNIVLSLCSGGVRVKMEMGSTPSPVVDIVTLRRLLEIMRLDSTPVLLKVCREREMGIAIMRE